MPVAPKKPPIPIRVKADVEARIMRYAAKHHDGNRNKAIVTLLETGLWSKGYRPPPPKKVKAKLPSAMKKRLARINARIDRAKAEKQAVRAASKPVVVEPEVAAKWKV